MRIGLATSASSAADLLQRAIALRPEHQVVWIATSGADAVERCSSMRPDLVIMDLQLTGMGGVEATRRIMTRTPCPVLLVTANVRAQAARVFEAMGHGALDAIDMPVQTAGDPRLLAAPLLAKIESFALLAANHRPPRDVAGASGEWLVAIGASAGGPAVLATLLGHLPKDLPAAIVIVQHVDEHFADSMAAWLDQNSPLPVTVAREGDRPIAGRVLLAGTSDHLIMTSGERLGYTAEPRDQVYRPSVDVFFQSVCRLWRGEVIGVLLTGMGRDGALGLKALRRRGHHTIAQDEATSAVYGMPKAAATLDAAVDILSADRIAPKLMELVSCHK